MPHATRRQRLGRYIARQISAVRSTLLRLFRPFHDFMAADDAPAHDTATLPAQTTSATPNTDSDLSNFPNSDSTDGQPSRAPFHLLSPTSSSQSSIRPPGEARSPHASRAYGRRRFSQDRHTAKFGRRPREERLSYEFAGNGVDPSNFSLGNLFQAREVARDEQREDPTGAISGEHQVIAAPQEVNDPHSNALQEHRDIGDSGTIPLPILTRPGAGVAPKLFGPAASTSETGAPLSFPSRETSSAHSDNSTLLHHSPAAIGETRRYDEGSARRELAAMMSDPPRRVVDQELEEGQQLQSVASDAAPAANGEAAQPYSAPQDGTPPDDNPEYSSDVADEDPARAARDVSKESSDSTYIHYRDFVVADVVFLGRRLLVSVGKRLQLPVPSESFDEGLRSLLDVCEARRHDLVQLHLEVHQVWVTGGQHATQDALDAILFNLRSYLRNFATAVISFTATDDGRAGQAVQDNRRAIAGGFSRLKHVRIQGNTSAARLSTFPLASLCALEVLIRITEADMIVLLRLCSDKLAFLAAGPIDDSQGNCLSTVALDSRAQAVPKKASPFVMYIKSQSPCEHLLKFIAQESVDVHFTLTDARGSARLRDIVDGHPTWTMRLD
ncbi:hypothetical protein EV122DRAFT_254071 [Schizophyllum commune]